MRSGVSATPVNSTSDRHDSPSPPHGPASIPPPPRLTTAAPPRKRRRGDVEADEDVFFKAAKVQVKPKAKGAKASATRTAGKTGGVRASNKAKGRAPVANGNTNGRAKKANDAPVDGSSSSSASELVHFAPRRNSTSAPPSISAAPHPSSAVFPSSLGSNPERMIPPLSTAPSLARDGVELGLTFSSATADTAFLASASEPSPADTPSLPRHDLAEEFFDLSDADLQAIAETPLSRTSSLQNPEPSMLSRTNSLENHDPMYGAFGSIQVEHPLDTSI